MGIPCLTKARKKIPMPGSLFRQLAKSLSDLVHEMYPPTCSDTKLSSGIPTAHVLSTLREFRVRSGGEAGGYLRCRIVPSSCSFTVQTFVRAALKSRFFIPGFSSPDVFKTTTSSTFCPKFLSFSGVADIVPGPGTSLNPESFLDKIFTEPGSACLSSKLFCIGGLFTTGGWGSLVKKLPDQTHRTLVSTFRGRSAYRDCAVANGYRYS